MPHDKFGQLLAVGDLVLVRATVREITTSSDFCNVKVETVEKERPAHLRASSSPDAPVGPQPWPVE
jgi:hypothetical protein